eukprot:5057053-Alexandrium_andersonii.AAC.1
MTNSGVCSCPGRAWWNTADGIPPPPTQHKLHSISDTFGPNGLGGTGRRTPSRSQHSFLHG